MTWSLLAGIILAGYAIWRVKQQRAVARCPSCGSHSLLELDRYTKSIKQPSKSTFDIELVITYVVDYRCKGCQHKWTQTEKS